MFGYWDNDWCYFDLWSPVDDQCKSLDTIYTHPHSKPGFPHATENRAFSAYAMHQQELEDIVAKVLERAARGETNFSLDLDYDLTDADLAYIEKAIQARF